MIKAGFCYCFGLKNWEASIVRLAESGYDGIEFWDNFLTRVDIIKLKEILDKNKTECAQICPYFDFTGGEAVWNRSIKIARKYIGWSKQLGKPLIRVFTGKVGPKEAAKKQWKDGVKGLQKICDMARSDGITFALECHENSLMEDSMSTLRLLNDVNRENLAVNLQLPLKGEDIWESIEKLGRHTVHMHVHNWVGKIGGFELTFLNSGVLDYKKLLRRLIKKGFSGYLSIEHPDHLTKHNPWLVAGIEAGYLKELKEYAKKLEAIR